MLKKRLIVLALASMGLTHNALAAEFTKIDSNESKIAFRYSQMNVKMSGNISAFTIEEFGFDPQRPEQALLQMTIPVTEVDAGYADANKELPKDIWLNAEAHPLASFKATELKANGDDEYELRGDLSIKGISQEITVPVTFDDKGETGTFTGEFTFKRNDFKLGEGSWSDTSIVADDIVVEFEIQVTQ